MPSLVDHSTGNIYVFEKWNWQHFLRQSLLSYLKNMLIREQEVEVNKRLRVSGSRGHEVFLNPLG